MKKLLLTLMTLLMSVSLVACGQDSSNGNGDGDVALKDTFSNIYVSDMQSLDYLATNKTTDFEILADLVDGLLEYDSYGHLIGALAEEWSSNEDQSVWTFKLRKGANWVMSTGEVYGEIKAEDFVTAIQHAADFESETGYLLSGVLKNYAEYTKGLVPFEEVGVKAVDDYTVEYTFETSVPYFESMTTYAIMYPVNKQFLESKGVGCALGAPDPETCEFGSLSPDSILYNGAFILTRNDAKSTIEMTKNEEYWDVENVHINTIKYIYDGGEDPYSAIKGFEQGTYDQASLRPTWPDFADYTAKYADNYYLTLPNSSSFAINFNYNRTNYNHTAKTTDEEKANTHNAILNKNFRLAVQAAYDRVAYLEIGAPTEAAIAMLRNMNNYPDIVTNSEGKTYGTLVEEAYKELTGNEIQLDDGQDPYLNPEKAMEYIEAAKAEGVNFPVHLDLAYINNDAEQYVLRAQSMKESIERNTQGNIIIDLIGEDKDTYYNIQYYATSPSEIDYDINTFSGWGPDYADPKSFVDIYSTTNGSYMKTLGFALTGDDTISDPVGEQLKAQIGLAQYEELYRAADAIVDDLDARYAAFAKADAFLIAEALALPGQQNSRGYLVSNVVPFTKQYSVVGIGDYKHKFMKVQNSIVTKEQYDAAYADFEANR